MFSDEEGGLQLTFEDDFSADYTLSSFLHTLQEAISEHRDEDSFWLRTCEVSYGCWIYFSARL